MPSFWPSKPAAERQQADDQQRQQPPGPSTATPPTSLAREQDEGRQRSQHPPRPLQEQVLTAIATPQTIISTLVLTSAALVSIRFYKRHLRRVPTTFYLKASDLPAPTSNSTHTTSTLRPGPSLFGTVTSVNDPDNFRLYHTPGGRLLLWSTVLRPIPKTRQALKDQTLHIRLAGIDAPELAHFGKPAQPYAAESLRFLKSLLEGRRVRVYPLRRDQYERVVALAFVSRGWLRGLTERWWEEWPYFWRKDIGLEAIRAGMATVYEAKVGVEFGGEERGVRYRAAEKEAKDAKRGIWGGSASGAQGSTGVLGRMAQWIGWKPSRTSEKQFESPRQYKDRMARLDRSKEEAERSQKLKG